MDDQNPIEKRFTALEIKASFAEDLLEQLNQVIVAQQQQLDRLARELAQLRAQQLDAAQPSARNLRDELPPHY